MDNTQKKRLERNLSQSASGAKPYWPRVLIGPGVETQGSKYPGKPIYMVLPQKRYDSNLHMGVRVAFGLSIPKRM